MELCTASAFSGVPHHHPGIFTTNHTQLQWKTSIPLKLNSISRIYPGLIYYTNSSLRSTTSEETSIGANQNVKDEPDGGITMEDAHPVQENEYTGTMKNEVPNEDSPVEDQAQLFDLLNKLDIKLDFEDSYSILLLGGSAVVALWLATVIVGAIDSIPVFPKLMEVVGFAYTLWFSTRYLIFKRNRDELTAKIGEIKQQVLGKIDE